MDTGENKFETNYSTLAASRRSRLNLKNPFSSRPNFTNQVLKLKSMSRKKIIIGVSTAAILIALFATFKFSTNSSSSGVLGDKNQKMQLPDAKASQTLNKEFTFPIKDDKGTQISTIKFLIENVEKRDEIVVK